MAQPQPARRRRSATRKGRPTLTRELIAERALEIAGAEGFPAVTMRRLAEELQVTVRAVYNYVSDRQEVVELATRAFIAHREPVEVDPDRWEESLRAYCAGLRELYRRYPRAILVSMDERIGSGGVHPARLHHPELLLGMLREIGVGVERAQLIHAELGLKLFAFALLVDYPTGRGTATAVPDEWLAAHADLAIPNLVESRSVGAPSPDELFEYIVETLIATVRAAAQARDSHTRPPSKRRQ